MGRRRWLWVPAVGIGALGVAALSARLAWYVPGPEERAPVACPEDAPLVRRGEPLKVLVWNVQYAASREYNFFYDGGPTVSVTEDDVLRTVEGIAAAIRAENPDIVLLQEVDRGSRRTAWIDEHALLREKLGLSCHTAAPYHKVPYVPSPSHEHLGAVDMNLSVFSRFKIDRATRFQLPLLQEPLYRRIFNLRRAMIDVRLPIEGGGELALFDTHLSAFSRGDGTLERQVAMLRAHAESAEAQGTPWILAGDLNMLPPDDDPTRVSSEVEAYGSPSPVIPLYEQFRTPFPRGDVDALRTYVPWGSTVPDRTIDYVFHGAQVEASGLRVLRDTYPLSDHLPFVIDVRIP